MYIHELDIAGVFEIRLTPIPDERGHFMRTYDTESMRAAGLHREWVQENVSRNERKGIVRGLHFQFPPSSETKLVRCTVGAVFDVFVDLRRGSETFGQWGGLTLSSELHNMVFIPRGFAHGYCTLSELSEVQYKVDHAYDRGREGGLLWSDPGMGIRWPLDSPPLLSVKDWGAMDLARFREQHGGL